MSKKPHLTAEAALPSHFPKGRSRREGSGIFTAFQPAQIQQFKEAFQLMDHDKDGWITQSDLEEMFTSLGIAPQKRVLDEMLKSRPGEQHSIETEDERGINFTMFLTMMSERLFQFDTETELLEAFECFDEDDTGIVKVEEMQKWLSEVGERMNDTEIDKFLKSSFADQSGNFNYREWTRVLRVEDDDA